MSDPATEHAAEATSAAANGKPAPTPAPAAAASTGGSAAPAVSRADLIALVQKLQKKAAAAEAQVGALKKQLAEAATPANANGTTAAATATAAGADSSAAAEIARLQSELASQSASHAAQLSSLQSELALRSDALADARRQLAQTREEHEASKLKTAATIEEGRKLAAQVAQLQQQLRAATAAAPASPPALSPSTSSSNATAAAPAPSISPAPGAAASPAAGSGSGGGGSFLLENVNRELRAALKDAEAKHALAVQKSQHYQQLVGSIEKQMTDAASQAASASDAASKRLQDLESKLSTSDQKLLKSFAMLGDEKKKAVALEADVKAVQFKHSAAQAALAHAQELLRDSTAALDQSQADNNALRTANFKLTQRIESSADDEAGDLRELRKTLASRTEEITALRNELDHTRSIHARTLQNLESELSLQSNEMEAGIETQKREAERMAREVHELRTASENDRRLANQQREELQARMDALQAERDAALAASSALESNLASLQRDLDALRSEHASSESSHAAAYASLSAQSGEKYARLIQELKAYKIHTISASVALKNELESAQDEIRKLQEEIQHGKPGERKIFELATLQASRDAALREAQAEVDASQKAQVELRGRLEQSRVERDFLAGEVKRHAVSQQRSAVNLDYLKSVMVQFLGYEHAPAHRKALFPVIAQLLCFTPEDHKAVEVALKSNAGSAGLWGSLGSLAGFSQAISTTAPAAKPISLPPSMPMGIDLSDAGHASPFGQSTPQTPADFGGSVRTPAAPAVAVAAGSTAAASAAAAPSSTPPRPAHPPAAQ